MNVNLYKINRAQKWWGNGGDQHLVDLCKRCRCKNLEDFQTFCSRVTLRFPLEQLESKPHNSRNYKRKYEREIVHAEEDVPTASETERSVCRCDAMHMCEVEVSTPLPPTHVRARMRSGTYARTIACPEKDDDVCVIISLFSARSRCSLPSPTLNFAAMYLRWHKIHR